MPEPLATIIHMRVVNSRAPHYGKVGWIVEVLEETDTRQSTKWIKLVFEAGGKPEAYEYGELELVMP